MSYTPSEFNFADRSKAMLNVTQVEDCIYQAATDDQRIFIVIAVDAKADSASLAVGKAERLLETLELKVQLAANWSLRLEVIKKSLDARSTIRKHLHLAADETIVVLLCKTQTVADYAVKVMNEYRLQAASGAKT